MILANALRAQRSSMILQIYEPEAGRIWTSSLRDKHSFSRTSRNIFISNVYEILNGLNLFNLGMQ